MIASVEPTTPSQRLPIGERGNLSERRVSASLSTFDHDIPVRGVRPEAVNSRERRDATLRENLGLAIPRTTDWPAARRKASARHL